MSSETFSIERVVTFLGPFFAAGATFVTGFVAQHTGVKLDPTALAVVMASAFLGSVALVIKWLHGRQIPAIAGLHITQAQLDELHSEVAAYLAQHSQALTAAETQVAGVVQNELDKRAPEFKPDVDMVVAEVLKRLSSLAGAAPPAAAGVATSGAASQA